MALITEQNILNLVYAAGYTGQSTGSLGSQDLTSSIGSGQTSVLGGLFNSNANITTGFNTYYKMQGWNPFTQIYEDWHSMGTPLLDPPSGNALENIGIIGTWKDR